MLEIQGTGTYTHTSEELQTGARLARQNSAKCIGRIAWNTLLVRNCRHAESAHDSFKEFEEHLRIATCGTNIQSVMSVFKPKAVNEMWGTRFWSSQFVRYAGYKNQENGELLGDPSNVDFTECKLPTGPTESDQKCFSFASDRLFCRPYQKWVLDPSGETNAFRCSTTGPQDSWCPRSLCL